MAHEKEKVTSVGLKLRRLRVSWWRTFAVSGWKEEASRQHEMVRSKVVVWNLDLQLLAVLRRGQCQERHEFKLIVVVARLVLAMGASAVENVVD